MINGIATYNVGAINPSVNPHEFISKLPNQSDDSETNLNDKLNIL
jgi:hypothetical protein